MKFKFTGLLLAMVFSAQAGAANIGVYTKTSSSYCPSSCVSGDYTNDGGLNATSASSTAFQPASGTATASADYSGAFSTPVLRASAEGTSSGAEVQALAFGAQLYTYTGSSSTTLTLNYSVHGVTSLSGLDAQIISSIAILSGAPASAGFGYSFATYVPEIHGGDELGGTTEFIYNGEDTLTGSISFFVNPGDTFTLAAEVRATVSNAATANASNTVSMTFVDGANLVPEAITAVPEPSTWALMGLGLFGLGWMRKRRA